MTSAAWKGLGDAVIGRRPFSRFIQVDRLAAVHTGAGPTTTNRFRLPHGRYTVFAAYERPAAVTLFALADDQDRHLPDWSQIPVRTGEFTAPLVQHELASGSYRIVIGTATPACAWQVQVILNSMLSWEAPPRQWRPSEPPPSETRVGSGDEPIFRITQTGRYDLRWTIGEAPLEGHPIRPYWLNIRGSDGYVIHLGGTATPYRDDRTSGAFLGAGEWTVEIKTSFEWRLTISPVVGPLGGGARGF